MPTPAERSALLFVAAVAAFGLAVRGCRALRPPPVPPDDRAALAVQLAAVDSVIAAGGRARATRPAGDRAARSGATAAPRPRAAVSAAPSLDPPPGPQEPVDVDRASAEELDRLPGIGPTLAARIVADREQHGPFGSLEGLQRVKGIGPALAGRLGPRVTFSGFARPPRAVGPARRHPYP